MKICIDISQTAYPGTGVARYTINLVKGLVKYDKNNTYIFFFSSLRNNVPLEIVKIVNKPNKIIRVYIPQTLGNIIWNKLSILPIEFFTGDIDIFISSDWIQIPSKAKKVTIIHDLVYHIYPKTLPISILNVQKTRISRVKNKVDMIVADSHSTKYDIVRYLKIPEEKITVVYPAIDIKQLSNQNEKAILTKYGILNTQYVLSVGKLEPRKNIVRLIEAFVRTGLKDTHLLIVGPKGWKGEIYNNQYPITNNQLKNIKFLGYVSDNELYTLYKNALFFIYPSLYEGFGYPIIEAMSMGCPIATSNTSSCRELADEYGLLFDPLSVNDIEKTIIQLSDSKNLRQKLAKKGLKRAKDFSLEKFSAQFINAINVV